MAQEVEAAARSDGGCAGKGRQKGADKKNPGAIATTGPGHQTRNGYINKCFTAKTNYGVCKLADI